MATAKVLGVVGCGNLGTQVSLRAMRAGLRLVAFDLERDRVPSGAEAARSVKDVVDGVGDDGSIVSVLPNDEALRTVAGELAASRRPLLHVSCSTVSPGASREVASAHDVAGQRFAAAPVFGRPENVRDDEATFVVSGPDRDAARALLSSFAAERTFDFGEDPGAANVVKLCGNYMIGASIQVIAEALALAEANDIDRDQLVDMLASTIFDCAIFNGYGRRVSRRDHRPGGFALEHGLKDVNLFAETATRAGIPVDALPFLAVLQRRFEDAKAAGHADLDWSAVALQTSPPPPAAPGNKWK